MTKLIKPSFFVSLLMLFIGGIFFITISFFLFIESLDSNQKIIFIVISFLILISICGYFIKTQIYDPIQLITKGIETNHVTSIKLLKKKNDEFGYIGNLLHEKLNQNYELVTAKQKAEESDRLKTTFLENLTHEIRTPMNAIIGFSDLLVSTKLSDEEKKEYLQIINKSGLNLVSIIDDLIEVSKINSNQIVPNYSDINLDNCLKELYETIKIDIPKSKKIDFFIIDNKKPLDFNIIVDEVKLKQIITNLVFNAIKFTDSGYVAFGYEIIEGNEAINIKFSIKDTGIGIEKKEYNTIFERFKRIESDTTINVGGLGLGLSISKAYVEVMGGTIWVEPNLDKGSVFSFMIPLKYDKTQKNGQIKKENFEENFENKRAIILIAEDDNINFLLIKKLIQSLNCEIIRAENGQVAVTICEQKPEINLLLLDIKMPVMNGYEAFNIISKMRPTLPIIAQTAYSSVEDREKIEKLGFTDYITKPLNKELLLEKISLNI